MTATEREQKAQLLWAAANKWHGTPREAGLRKQAREVWPGIVNEITIEAEDIPHGAEHDAG